MSRSCGQPGGRVRAQGLTHDPLVACFCREAFRRHTQAETNSPMHIHSQQAQLRNARSVSLKQRWRLSDHRSELEGLMQDLDHELSKQRTGTQSSPCCAARTKLAARFGNMVSRQLWRTSEETRRGTGRKATAQSLSLSPIEEIQVEPSTVLGCLGGMGQTSSSSGTLKVASDI
eukprot:7381804-Prymnesium_polylepis.1